VKPGAVHEAKGTVGAFIITEAAPPPREARLRDHLLASCVSALAVKSVVLGSNTKCKAGAKKLAHPACVFPHSTCVATRGYSTNGEIANKLAAVSGVAVTQVARSRAQYRLEHAQRSSPSEREAGVPGGRQRCGPTVCVALISLCRVIGERMVHAGSNRKYKNRHSSNDNNA